MAPDIPKNNPKSQMSPVQVQQIAAKRAQAQALPRQMFGPQRPSLGASMAGSGMPSQGGGNRYDPAMISSMLNQGKGYQ